MAMFATTYELEDFADASFTLTRSTLAIELASSACESVAKSVNGTIEQVEDDVRSVDGSGTSLLTLPAWPVTDIESVLIGDDPVTDFAWSRNGVLERTSGVWPKGRRNITVTFTHGFAVVPTEIKAVTLQAASRSVLNPARLNSFSDGQVSVGFGGGGTGTQVLDLLGTERDMVLRAIR